MVAAFFAGIMLSKSGEEETSKVEYQVDKVFLPMGEIEYEASTFREDIENLVLTEDFARALGMLLLSSADELVGGGWTILLCYGQISVYRNASERDIARNFEFLRGKQRLDYSVHR